MIKCPNCGNTKRIALSATDGKAYCTVYHLEGTGCGYAGPKTEFQEPEVTGYRKLPERDLEVINALKEVENGLGDMIKEFEADHNFDKRWIAIARTDLQKGFMALVRSVARPESRL